MPLQRESFLVPYCPVCDCRIDLQHSGDSKFQVWDKRADVVEMVQYTDGKTFEEKLAASCSEECYLAYRPKTRKSSTAKGGK